ncbi:MAG TPA: hypothetical protein VIX63_08705 [Vicinamibacterales bacterium]
MSNDAFNRTANVIFIVTCVVLVALAVTRRNDATAGAATVAPGARAEIVATGTKLDPINGVSYTDADLTVALVLNTECPFCRDSIPFYRQLTERRRAGKVQLVAASLEPRDALEQYLREHDVAVDHVVHLDRPEAIPTTGTPTVVVIGRDGVVRSSWLGRLDSTQERDLLRAITVS